MKAVIFCGGVGTRLWPMSRENFPKQFLLMIGDKSIFRQTVERVLKGFEPEDTFISTGAEFARYVVEQAPEIPQKNIILEPDRRDSLGAVGYATAYVHHYFPHTVMAAIWGADHLVDKVDTFHKALKVAGKVADEERVICKVDTRPTYPSTDNGWVEIGKPIKKIDGLQIYEFVRFIEKPNLEVAKQLFRSFEYLVNVGYMAWNTDVMLSLYKRYQPHVYSRLQKIEQSIGTGQEQEVLAREYPNIEKDSIDYGIFEKLKPSDMRVIPTDLGWIDIGTWDLLYNGMARNTTDNVVQADAHVVDTKGSLIWGNGKRLIGVVGVEDLIVVDTNDALLICRRGRSGDVKNLLKLLKDQGKKEVL
ncbi:mannose-1-phosphate guanylyltransferase [Candidatus Gottesmanbacteria bacterium]|nr:mannose-1-phosphate guanylyltransferase [Candidatus Gottesmanbacteria bacterium]